MQTKYPTGRQCITPPLFLLFLSIAWNLARNIVGLRIPTEATQCEINRGQTNRTTKLSGEKAKARPPEQRPHPHLIFQDPSERLNRVVGDELEEQRRLSRVEEDFYGAAILFRFRRLLERRRGTRKKKQLLVGGGGGG